MTCFTLYVSVHLQVWLTFPPKWIPSPPFLFGIMPLCPFRRRAADSHPEVLFTSKIRIYSLLSCLEISYPVSASLSLPFAPLRSQAVRIRSGRKTKEWNRMFLVQFTPPFCCMNIVVHKEYQLFRFLFYD